MHAILGVTFPGGPPITISRGVGHFMTRFLFTDPGGSAFRLKIGKAVLGTQAPPWG